MTEFGKTEFGKTKSSKSIYENLRSEKEQLTDKIQSKQYNRNIVIKLTIKENRNRRSSIDTASRSHLSTLYLLYVPPPPTPTPTLVPYRYNNDEELLLKLDDELHGRSMV